MSTSNEKPPSVTSAVDHDLAAVTTFMVERIAKGAITTLVTAIIGLLVRMRDLNTELMRKLASKSKKRPPSDTMRRLQRELPLLWAAPANDSGPVLLKKEKKKRGPKTFAQHGRPTLPSHLPHVPLAANTLASSVGALIDLFDPVVKHLREACLLRFTALDATRMPALDSEHPLGVRSGALWLIEGDHRYACFLYAPSAHPPSPHKSWRGDAASPACLPASMLPLEGTLLEKLRKIEALHAGTTVDGKREAARRCRRAYPRRLAELRPRDEDVELFYSLPDPVEEQAFPRALSPLRSQAISRAGTAPNHRAAARPQGFPAEHPLAGVPRAVRGAPHPPR